jgi:hypothetical protein
MLRPSVTGNLRGLSPIRCSSRQTSRRAGLVARSLSVAHSPGGNWACCCAGPLAAGKLRHVLRRGPLRDRGRLLRRALRVVRAIFRWHVAASRGFGGRSWHRSQSELTEIPLCFHIFPVPLSPPALAAVIAEAPALTPARCGVPPRCSCRRRSLHLPHCLASVVIDYELAQMQVITSCARASIGEARCVARPDREVA